MKFSTQRGWLLRIIFDNPNISITQLSKVSGVSRGTTIYRYLEELESKGLIEMNKTINEKTAKEKGQPTYLKATKKAKPMEWAIYQALGYDVAKAKSLNMR